MKRVLIIEAQMKRYREPFYGLLHAALAQENIQLRVVYSDPAPSEIQKQDNCGLPGGYGVKVKGYWLGSERLFFQPALGEIAAADLVVIDQANKFILNHLLLPLSLLRWKNVAFWGLGENLQSDRSSFSEWYKKRTLNWVRWWFAYTEGTARYLAAQGVPQTKITAVQNSVDTRSIQACIKSLTPEAKASLRAKLGISFSAPVGIFVGMLHKIKSVPFLIQSGETIRHSIPEFQLLVVGGGPDEEEIKRSAAHLSWVHFVGPQFGDRKSQFLAISDVFLLPGRVGLAVLDGFAAGLPLVATRLAIHGPEIEYLEHGYNGLLTAPEPGPYAGAVAHLLSRPPELRVLSEGAARSAAKYSIETMVENFRRGIAQCLCLGAIHSTPSRPEEGIAPRTVPLAPALPVAPYGSTCHQLEQPRLPKDHRADAPSPAEQRLLLTTSWDDGHPLDFRVAELLDKYGLAGTFYVPRSSQKTVMSAAPIRELSSHFEIGGHTLEHVRIDRLSDRAALAQLSGSRQWLEQLTGKSCRAFCFPGGKFRTNQLDLVLQAGYQSARTVELLSTANPRWVNGLWLIPTTIQVFPHGPIAYAKNALKRFSASTARWPRKTLLSHDWLTLAQDFLLRAAKHGGVFHLWGHSWEIEEQHQWQNLEAILAAMSACDKAARCVTNSELCGFTGNHGSAFHLLKDTAAGEATP